MTMGTDWDELSVPYSDPTNSEIAMDMAPDRYRFILGGPVVMEPGKRWIYNGGTTALLARIIAKGTGKPLHEFAARRCSILSVSARRNGMPIATAKRLPHLACA
jgi:CubicO group peptidase (beta-lactamase class C family)